MKNIILLLVLAGSLMYCKDTPKQNGDGAMIDTENQPVQNIEGAVQLKGLLLQNGDQFAFRDFKENKMYAVVDQTKMLDSAYARAAAPCHYLSESVYAVLTGKLLAKSKAFEVISIDSMEGKTAENMQSVGAPFEFWCHGTNPDWDIEISNKEGGIFYQNPSEGAAWFCPWIKPVEKGDSWIYNVPAGTSTTISGALLIHVKKEKAKDGRADKGYAYSVEVDVRGKKLKGVAVRGTGKVLGPDANDCHCLEPAGGDL